MVPCSRSCSPMKNLGRVSRAWPTVPADLRTHLISTKMRAFALQAVCVSRGKKRNCESFKSGERNYYRAACQLEGFLSEELQIPYVEALLSPCQMCALLKGSSACRQYGCWPIVRRQFRRRPTRAGSKEARATREALPAPVYNHDHDHSRRNAERGHIFPGHRLLNCSPVRRA